jgi:DNA-binding CsgD family transcriptional regulator
MSPYGGKRVLDRWFGAYNAHDLDALCLIAHPEIELAPIDDSLTAPSGATYRGHLGLRSLIGPGFERFPRMSIDCGPAREVAGRVVVDIDFLLDDGREQPQIRRTACIFGVAGQQLTHVAGFDRGTVTGLADRWKGDWDRASQLTPREREILTLQADGHTVREIAEQLVLSPLTVRTHVRNAKDRLGARTNAHAVAIVVRGQLFRD